MKEARTREITPEQIAKHYSAAMDSVNLINKLVAKENKTEQELEVIARNVKHLEIMVGRDYWTTEDLTPFNDAIIVGG